MTEAQISLLETCGDGAGTLRNAVTHCLNEVRALVPDTGRGTRTCGGALAVIAGIGTTAPRALHGTLLLDALTAHDIEITDSVVFPDPAALLADSNWDLALVLSPWKQEVAGLIHAHTGSAARTGVVDTLLRSGELTTGVNTNSWAAQAAMETVLGGRTPSSVLVLGAGGSSNSVALACRRAWPGAQLIGSARDATALASWAAGFGAEPVAPDGLKARFAEAAPALVVNTTTWGETDESEQQPFVFDFGELTAPGNSYFDLNNRVSALQTAALRAGMNVMSGTFMQRVTNACRAALLQADVR
ncbi:hypothetical protein HGA13_15750 [Nocardia speluncae]|uniref:Shikimate dehydrogenase n=1 Tax=Nocardia speluncae TaxID=419477 RepID=A0A846XIQ0_9NOCA|nr:hypothetical protein [Nocardia speluncae]NKY34516.1 hypothetical protein [Nocardia speluncae]